MPLESIVKDVLNHVKKNELIIGKGKTLNKFLANRKCMKDYRAKETVP